MNPVVLELDLPEVTEWLPDHERLPAEVNDAWIEREQALRWKPGEDRGSSPPVNVMFWL
ncbi:MAG: hypothetical protein IPK32_16670 [Verrucomicrobiaceae bacterium]|nr:hypothetical protein [Verrucomicrobiaceae bacterium]